MTHFTQGGGTYACGRKRRRPRDADTHPQATTCRRCKGTEGWGWAAQLHDFLTA